MDCTIGRMEGEVWEDLVWFKIHVVGMVARLMRRKRGRLWLSQFRKVMWNRMERMSVRKWMKLRRLRLRLWKKRSWRMR